MPARGTWRALVVARQQAVEQGSRPVAGRRVHHQASRLVDDQQVLVLIDHVQQPWSSGWKAMLCCVGRISTLQAVAHATLAEGLRSTCR